MTTATGTGSTNPMWSGFGCYQTSALNDANDTGQLSANTLVYTPTAYSAATVYGSDGTAFSQALAFWSGSVLMRLVTPAAMVSGTVYKGNILFGQLYRNAMTVQQLMSIASS